MDGQHPAKRDVEEDEAELVGRHDRTTAATIQFYREVVTEG